MPTKEFDYSTFWETRHHIQKPKPKIRRGSKTELCNHDELTRDGRNQKNINELYLCISCGKAIFTDLLHVCAFLRKPRKLNLYTLKAEPLKMNNYAKVKFLTYQKIARIIDRLNIRPGQKGRPSKIKTQYVTHINDDVSEDDYREIYSNRMDILNHGHRISRVYLNGVRYYRICPKVLFKNLLNMIKHDPKHVVPLRIIQYFSRVLWKVNVRDFKLIVKHYNGKSNPEWSLLIKKIEASMENMRHVDEWKTSYI